MHSHKKDANTGDQYFVTPVSFIHHRGEDIPIPMETNEGGKYTQQMKTWVHDIMYGQQEHEWGVVVAERE